jgi:hypothetical protein
MVAKFYSNPFTKCVFSFFLEPFHPRLTSKFANMKKVIREKVTDKLIFCDYYCVQKFSAYNFFWVNFSAFFSTESNSVLNFAFYDTHREFSHQNFFSLY